jgi:endonuclease/exonuclease/phosphatase family metal-dependent hydrolase
MFRQLRTMARVGGCVLAAVVLGGVAQDAGSDAKKSSAKQTPASHRFGLQKAPARKPGTVRIAAYNIGNFFDHVDDPNLQGEYDDLPMATPDERCRALAAAIKAVDADIISLEEVESLEALTWFRDTYLKDAGYQYLASKDAGYYRGVEQSVMSRFPITEARVWLNESLDDVKREGEGWTKIPANEKNLTFQRSPLMVEVKINDRYSLTIFALHHKAGPSFGWHREAEALRMADFIRQLEERDPSRNIIVMGDFNCAPWDKSMRVYLQNGLTDTMAYRIIDKDNPESHLFKTHESDKVLDYILMNSAAFREYAPGSGFVLGTVTPPASGYDYTKDPPPPGFASDHYPIAVDIMPLDRP